MSSLEKLPAQEVVVTPKISTEDELVAVFKKDVLAYKIALECFGTFKDKEDQKRVIRAITKAQKTNQKFRVVVRCDDWSAIWQLDDEINYCPCCVPTDWLVFSPLVQ